MNVNEIVASGMLLLIVTPLCCMAVDADANLVSVTTSNMSLTVSAPKRVEPADNLGMTVVLSNGSNKKFNYYWTGKYTFLHPKVSIAGRKMMLPLTRYGKRRYKGPLASESSGLDAFRSLQPGRDLSLKVELSRLFDMTLEGDYAVSVYCRGQFEGVAGPIALSATNLLIRVLSGK